MPAAATTSLAAPALFGVGVLLLLHAAYSCLHYRALLQELDQNFSLPTDVCMEALAAFGIVLLSELTRSGSALQPVIGGGGGGGGNNNKKKRPLMAPPYITRDFDVYTTRARGMTTR